MNSPRSGAALYMILAILLGLVIIGTTFTLNSLRKVLPPPFLLKQKADYQMESAFVFCLPKLDNREAAISGNPIIRQEIAPGTVLTVTALPAENGSWILNAWVKAESWTRSLSARAVKNPAPAESLASDTHRASPSGSWQIFFLPTAETPTPVPPGRTGS